MTDRAIPRGVGRPIRWRGRRSRCA
jgi:hypothetical protein